MKKWAILATAIAAWLMLAVPVSAETITTTYRFTPTFGIDQQQTFSSDPGTKLTVTAMFTETGRFELGLVVCPRPEDAVQQYRLEGVTTPADWWGLTEDGNCAVTTSNVVTDIVSGSLLTFTLLAPNDVYRNDLTWFWSLRQKPHRVLLPLILAPPAATEFDWLIRSTETEQQMEFSVPVDAPGLNVRGYAVKAGNLTLGFSQAPGDLTHIPRIRLNGQDIGFLWQWETFGDGQSIRTRRNAVFPVSLADKIEVDVTPSAEWQTSLTIFYTLR